MQESASPEKWAMRESASHASIACGAAAIGWATMSAAVALFAVWTGGLSPFWSTLGIGLFAAVPSGVGGWICAATAKSSPKAAWPLLIVPACMLALVIGLTASSIVGGPQMWKDPKSDPINLIFYTMLANGPTLMACIWAWWSSRPVSESIQTVE